MEPPVLFQERVAAFTSKQNPFQHLPKTHQLLPGLVQVRKFYSVSPFGYLAGPTAKPRLIMESGGSV
jgi:hypothetical protein